MGGGTAGLAVCRIRYARRESIALAEKETMSRLHREMAELRRGDTFARTYRKGMDFASELPHCGWKLLGMIAAVCIILFGVGSTIWVGVVWLWGGREIRWNVPEMVQKSSGSDVGL